jgi:hypothetical protein
MSSWPSPFLLLLCLKDFSSEYYNKNSLLVKKDQRGVLTMTGVWCAQRLDKKCASETAILITSMDDFALEKERHFGAR